MTRLTTDVIEDVEYTLRSRDADLMDKLGLTLKDLARTALCPQVQGLDLSHIRAAAVPVTSGKGIINTFSNSVCAITRHLGMDSFVTRNADVAGLSEALAAGADIVFMADDQEFIALNVREGKYADNTRSTALGYTTALEVAMGGATGKDVLVVGAGRVGSCAIERLTSAGAKVSLFEVDRQRAERAREKYGVELVPDLEAGVRSSRAILNASPARFPGHWIMEGAVISTPGVPYGFDQEGERRAKVIIHDPLQIGVAVMAVWSASYSPGMMPMEGCAPATAEAVQ